MIGLTLILCVTMAAEGAVIQSKNGLMKENKLGLETDEDYDIPKEESDILIDFDGTIEISQAVEILFDEMLQAFDKQIETMKIPREIDPAESTILVEDAEETLGIFIKNQMAELESLGERIRPLVDEDMNDTNSEINWNNYIEVIGIVYTRYKEILEYIEDGEYSYEYESEEEDEDVEDTTVHYIDSTQVMSELTKPISTTSSDRITNKILLPKLCPFFYIAINLSLIAILCSAFVIFYISPSKKYRKALIVSI